MSNNHPLLRALRSDDLDKVKQQLATGASAKSDVQTQYFPLHEAAARNAFQAMTLLQQHGAQINEDNIHGQTPLHVAASHGCAMGVKKLIVMGANPRRTDRNGNTALHLAAQLSSGRTQSTAARDLIAAGADVNAVNNDGVSVAQLAAQSGSMEMVGALLRAGANANHRSNNGRTLIDFARPSDQAAIKQMLPSSSAKYT